MTIYQQKMKMNISLKYFFTYNFYIALRMSYPLQRYIDLVSNQKTFNVLRIIIT